MAARRAVLLAWLAQAHALRLARPPALKPKRLAKAATLTTAALAGGARKALASGVEAAAGGGGDGGDGARQPAPKRKKTAWESVKAWIWGA
mmetsp:Transcript_14090/g.40298  ORF Transcript_14090/g.40298 Transcript_14090/m.40298 type:complete len:91 (+) Transcript_14090:144-416(+)